MTSAHTEILQLTPKKEFGQNFLIQASAIRAICQNALASRAPRILEIGPGPGVLTATLLEDGRDLWAMELDPEACEVLGRRFAAEPRFHLLQGDAVTMPLPGPGPWSLVGNLPYNAATAILTRFLVSDAGWDRMVFMFQREVAEKLMGKPGEKAYGPLSILAQLSARLTRIVRLGPGAFRPPPKVDSAVLLFEPRVDALEVSRRGAFLSLLHRSFAHRRKTLANNWQGLLPGAGILALLEGQGLPPAVRAEALSPAQWLTLFRTLEGHPDLSPDCEHA